MTNSLKDISVETNKEAFIENMSLDDFYDVWLAAKEKFGVAGVAFSRLNAEYVRGEPFTDGEWNMVRKSRGWDRLDATATLAMFESLEAALDEAYEDAEEFGIEFE